ncbi:MAG: rSAM/selenodomain-associated transferase 2/rSAM/selenodomain-associated transferase 1 [Kiritimatiellia bacterium]|jgi:rSAM/selenodomain-associated transferase 2/rSAM/selenodomain-associated transferase 1
MISVIIPTWRSGSKLQRTLTSLQPLASQLEIIIVDTEDLADTHAYQSAFPACLWLSAPKGRGPQQNAGASAATGDILLFLHSDTLLAEGWIPAVEQAVTRPGFILGAFRFTLDPSKPVFRLIEDGVRLRNRLLQLPYGDQALFTTREQFDSLGGFPNQPLMEDVELVWKARRRGKLTFLPLAATTSAERWQRDGVFKRTWINGRTYWSYKHQKARAETLVTTYENLPEQLIIFAKRPEPGKVKTRLAATVGDDRALQIYRQLVAHTLKQARACRAKLAVHFAPVEAEVDMRTWLGDDLVYIAQPDGDLGARMLAAFSPGRCSVIIGTDCPGITDALIHQAFDQLDHADLVVGPTDDGGYYLIGAREPYPELFRAIPWSTDAVYALTRARAAALGLTVAELPQLSDVDVEADLVHVEAFLS